ncbi:MAG: hypothetical protein KC635_04610, partial [Myxococcales bacterium]|nr:hypothetical protein [Myxococcales bacterium]
MNPTLVLLIVGAVLTVVGYAVSLTRKGRVADGHAGQVPLTATVPVGPVAAFERARDGVGSPFRVDDAGFDQLAVAFSSNPTFFGWGFLYHATFTPQAGGGTVIAVSARSRFIAPFPAIRDWHLRRCLRAIEAAAVRPLVFPPAVPARRVSAAALP